MHGLVVMSVPPVSHTPYIHTPITHFIPLSVHKCLLCNNIIIIVLHARVRASQIKVSIQADWLPVHTVSSCNNILISKFFPWP